MKEKRGGFYWCDDCQSKDRTCQDCGNCSCDGYTCVHQQALEKFFEMVLDDEPTPPTPTPIAEPVEPAPEKKRFKTIAPPRMSSRIPADDNTIAVKLSRLHVAFAEVENSGYAEFRKDIDKQAIARRVSEILAEHDREVAEHARWVEAGRPDLAE